MEATIYRFILRYSRREQLLLLALTIISYPFFYYSLDLPKTIVNEAINGTDFPQFVLGLELEQIPYLMILCGFFLVLVLINGGFKYIINVYGGIVGERMLRRLRYEIYARVLRFPLSRFRKLSQGEVVSMIVSETEPLGGFIGDAIKLPAYQGGQLLTLLIFMFVQDPVLGLSAVILYPLQIWLITKLQRKLNAYKKDRVRLVRKASERIGEVVGGVQEIHTHDTSQYELTEYADRMGTIYDVRINIFFLKFLIKFLNNFIAQVTPFFFYAIGGYLVIMGDLTFGALVAVIAAYEKLSSPWKELLNFYQIMEDARIKYDLLLESFRDPNMLDSNLQSDEPATNAPLQGRLTANNVDLRDNDEETSPFPGNLSFMTQLPATVAIVGTADSGTNRVAQALTGLKRPSHGTLTIGDLDLMTAPESTLGRRIAYVGNEPNLFSGTLQANLLYGLKHRPTCEPDYDDEARTKWQRSQHNAKLSGNITHDINADWVDYTGAGVADPKELLTRTIEVLDICDMREDVYRLGLQGIVNADQHPQLVARLLEARDVLRKQLQQKEFAPLVELFDRTAYNTNMSVAENLLFGAPTDTSFNPDVLGQNQHVLKVLDQTNLTTEFLRIGREVAAIMIDLFADVPPESELFAQYSFISAEDLPEFRLLLTGTETGEYQGELNADQQKLLSLPFRLIVSRHRLGLIDETIQQRILEARHQLAQMLDQSNPPIEFFDRDRYNSAVSVQDNILFGRLVYGRARSETTIGALIQAVVDQLGLNDPITELGLDYQVGVAGGRLTSTQRQKLAIARCVLKRPDILVIDRATAALDNTSQTYMLDNITAEFADRSLIWILHRASLSEQFDYTLVFEDGRVVEQGRFEELNHPGKKMYQLLQTD